jgi:hypothetical protein
MSGYQCDFLPQGAAPQTCHSALPRTSDQATNLHYEPLNKSRSEIRVLCPHAIAGDSIDKLEFTIRTVSLNDKPKYWALSYVWGGPQETEPLCVAGQTFMATCNLREALKSVRNLMTTETLDLQLWVDAISINQSDMVEKSWQVDIMARIYSQAYCVNVWLGLSDHNTALAVELVSKIGSQDFNEGNPLPDEQFLAICEDSMNRSLKQEKGDNLELVWALENLFHHRQYWTRAWTFQEFCLNRSVLWCGDSWVSLGSAFIFIQRSRDLARRAQIAGPTFGNITPVLAEFVQCIGGDIGLVLIERLKAGTFSEKDGDYWEFNEEEKLGILLCQTIGRHASEPKDKIYSLLGLCKVDITPDYSDSLSLGRLYQDTSALILKKTGSTELLTVLLSCAGLCNQNHLHGMPTWAIDWDTVAKASVTYKVQNMAANNNFIAKYPPLHFSNSELFFQAIIIDEVVGVLVPRSKLLGEPEAVEVLKFFFNHTAREILPFILQYQPRYKSGMSLFTAVLSTLLLGRDVLNGSDYDRLFVDKRPCENFRKCAKVFLRFIDTWECTGNFVRSLESYFRLQRRDPESEAVTRKHIVDNTIDKIFGFRKGLPTHDEVLDACRCIIPPADGLSFHNKTPFGPHANQMAVLKSKEGYIGAGRAGIAAHDVICVLRDVSTPFILRPIGEKFALVSPCYIEGLMDGEAWEMVQAGDKSIREVAIV